MAVALSTTGAKRSGRYWHRLSPSTDYRGTRAPAEVRGWAGAPAQLANTRGSETAAPIGRFLGSHFNTRRAGQSHRRSVALLLAIAGPARPLQSARRGDARLATNGCTNGSWNGCILSSSATRLWITPRAAPPPFGSPRLFPRCRPLRRRPRLRCWLRRRHLAVAAAVAAAAVAIELPSPSPPQI